jgi:hypothetical protein
MFENVVRCLKEDWECSMQIAWGRKEREFAESAVD